VPVLPLAAVEGPPPCAIKTAWGDLLFRAAGQCLRRLVGAFLIAFAIVLVWWLRIEPRNDRDWQPEVAVLPYAEINGDLVTIHNIRNFDYRSETDFTPRYYDKTFDLRRLDTVDLIASYWMG
jgi:hypothetical protein